MEMKKLKSPPIEHRRWFNMLVSILGVSIALICLIVVRMQIPKSEQHVQLALALLFIGAVSGFIALFRLFLPLILLKIWPKLEE